MGVTGKREVLPGRKVRADDDLWNAAKTKARAEGIPLSELVRNWLTDYINDDQPALTDLNRIILRLNDVHKRLTVGGHTNGRTPELETQ